MPPLVESERQSQHGTWIEIDRERLLSNLVTLKGQSAPFADVIAMIKANGYGHGLLEIAKPLDGSVSFFGVSSVREALTLKEHQIRSSILIVGRLFPHEIPAVLTEGISLSVSSLEEAREIALASEKNFRATPIHIKVDTGMGRLGIPLVQAMGEIEKINKLPGIILEGIYTHFPTAEREDGFMSTQVRDFSMMLESLERKGITFRYRHGANSAGSLKIHTPILNLIRPGIMLYGIYPDPSLKEIASVLPVLSLKSKILFLKSLKPGDSAGYGRDFVADKPTTIALLPIGYSHGYPWRLSNKSWVIYRGKKFPLAGRVSMDYLAFDLQDTHASIGDEVTLIGEDGTESIQAEDLAQWAGTSVYEIITGLDCRLPRFCR
ncbi:MAG: alanine racemase [Candidatus Omnitrophica bacterium]|nr:alanine racemase [Candidatus Omnitrophota bacterium]